MDRCISNGGFLAHGRFEYDTPAIVKLSDQIRELLEENAILHQRDAELSSRIAKLEALVSRETDKPREAPFRDFPKIEQWEDLTIKLIGYTSISVSAQNGIITKMFYNDLHFEDMKRTALFRNESLPVAAWGTLIDLARHNGCKWVVGDKKQVSRLKKHIQLINRNFKEKFLLDSNPIRISTARGERKQWVSRFKISVVKRFQTRTEEPTYGEK